MTGSGSDRPWEMAPGALGSHPFLSKHLCWGCPTPIPSSILVIYSSHSSVCVCQPLQSAPSSLPLPAWCMHPSPSSAPWAASALASQRVTCPLHYPPSAPRCILNLNSALAREQDPWHSALGLQRRPEWADPDDVSSGAAAQPGSGGVGLKGGSVAQ